LRNPRTRPNNRPEIKGIKETIVGVRTDVVGAKESRSTVKLEDTRLEEGMPVVPEAIAKVSELICIVAPGKHLGAAIEEKGIEHPANAEQEHKPEIPEKALIVEKERTLLTKPFPENVFLCFLLTEGRQGRLFFGHNYFVSGSVASSFSSSLLGFGAFEGATMPITSLTGIEKAMPCPFVLRPHSL